MHRTVALALALALLPSAARAVDVQPFVDLETGAIWASRIDVAVPGDRGQRFSLVGGDFQTRTSPFARLQAGLLAGRHRVYATFAPVRLEGNGSSGATVLFRDLPFVADGGATAKYRFDTYRLTYRYALVARPRFDLQVGVTALLRDAEIRLEQAGQSTAEKNLGFVPLVSFRVAAGLFGPVRLALDGDALAARQGRAEDVSLAVELDTGDLTFRAGYRVLEGGVDSKKVYNFSWINHAVVGVRYQP